MTEIFDDSRALATPAAPSRARRLAALCLGHATIDAYGAFLAPIVALVLAPKLGFGDAGAARLLALNVAVLSLAQPFFGYFADRRGGRAMVLLTPAVAGLAAGHFLMAPNLLTLILLVVASAAAIAAFHPEAAATAGWANPSNPAASTSLFIAAGPIGIASGPLLISWAAGLPEPPLWLPWLGPAVALLLWRLLPREAFQRPRAEQRGVLWGALSSRKGTLALLVAISSSRYFVGTALAFGLPLLLADRLGPQEALATAGFWLSLFLAANAVGGIAGSALLRGRTGIWANPLSMGIGAVLLVLLPSAQGATALLVLVAAGAALGWTGPLIVALGQRVVPEGAALASALTLGASWALGGPIAPIVFQQIRAASSSHGALLAVAGVAAVAALLSLGLGRAIHLRPAAEAAS